MVVHIQTPEHNLRLMQAERNKIISILNDRVKPTPYISHLIGPWLHPEEAPQESLPSIDLDATGTARAMALEAMKQNLNNHPNSETQPLNSTTHSGAERQMQAVTNPIHTHQRRKSLYENVTEQQQIIFRNKTRHKSESSGRIEKKSRPSRQSGQEKSPQQSPQQGPNKGPKNPCNLPPPRPKPQQNMQEQSQKLLNL